MAVDARMVKDILIRHKRLKGLSLVLAVLTWFIIQDTISFEIQIPDIKLQVHVQEGMAILNQSVSTVDITLRGSQEEIQLVDSRRLQVVVEMSQDSSPLPQEVHLTSSMVRGVRGARVVAVHPSRILVTLDRKAEKRLPVKGRTSGVPLFGQVQEVMCEPSTVLLRGPAAKLQTLECVYTQPLDVEGRVESFARRSAIQAPGDNWGASMDPADVQVKVTISGKSTGRQWAGVPVNTVVEPGRAMLVDVDPPSVDVMVKTRLGDAVSAEPCQVKAFADCIGLNTPGTYTVPVHVYCAGEATAVAVPDSVKVTVKMPGR